MKSIQLKVQLLKKNKQKKLSTCRRQGGWVKVQLNHLSLYHGCAKVILLPADTQKWSRLPYKLGSHYDPPHSQLHFTPVPNVLRWITWSYVLPPQSRPWRHLTPIPDNPRPQCSICILIAIQQSMPVAPRNSARPVKAQLARKWASHTFRVHRPWDGSFAGGEHSELNLPPGALWTAQRHYRYYQSAWQARGAFTFIVNVFVNICFYSVGSKLIQRRNPIPLHTLLEFNEHSSVHTLEVKC